MKTKKTLAFILTLMLALVACKPANQLITVVPIDGSRPAPAGRGVFYALPRTAITVDVNIDRIQQVLGSFAEYAGRFLGLGNIIRTNATTYRIAGIQINSFSEPDPQQLYFVSIPPEKLMNNTFFISLTESGLLQSINMPFDNREIQTGGDVTTPMGTSGNETGVLFYRIPEHAVVTILSGNTPRASSRMLINQFGIVTALPMHGQGVMFYPKTGSIKSMGATDANQ